MTDITTLKFEELTIASSLMAIAYLCFISIASASSFNSERTIVKESSPT